MVALSVQNLYKHFDGVQAVNNLSFEVLRGEIFGLLGPNHICRTNWQFVLHFAPTHLRYTRLLGWLLVLAVAGCSTPVQVEWTTETEMNTAGFNLYRSQSPNGPFDFKVNAHLIPASPDPLTGRSYKFTDPTARPGVTYYYLLQEVETTGGVNTHGPIAVQTAWLDWRWVAVAGGLAFVIVLLFRQALRSV